MQTVLALLAYLPWGFLLAVCCLEGLSAAKRDDRYRPGALTSLFGAVATTALAVVAGFAVPLATPDAPAATLAWPPGIPNWGGVAGIGATSLIVATYVLNQLVRRRVAGLAAPGIDEKAQRRAAKAAADLRLGYLFALAAAAIITAFHLLATPTGNPLSQMLAFAPISLAAAVVWLELVAMAKASPANQPGALAVLGAAAATAAIAVAVAFLANRPADAEEASVATSLAPDWRSAWGCASAVALAVAYLLKVAAKNKPASTASLRNSGLFARRAATPRGSGGNLSPAGYTFFLVIALALLAVTHLPQALVGDALAKLKSSGSDALAGAAELAGSDEGTSPAGDGSLGNLLAEQQGKPTQPPTGETPAEPVSAPPGEEPMAPEDPASPPGSETAGSAPIAAAGETDNSPEMAIDPVADPDPKAVETTGTPMAMNGIPDPTDPDPDPSPSQPAANPTPAPEVLTVNTIKPYDGGRFFTSQVVGILRSNCYDCHGPDKAKGGLRLDSPAAIRTGGDGGSVVLAGNPDRSHLYFAVSLPADDPDIMPPKDGPISEREQAILKRWIIDGAHMDDGENTTAIAVAQNAGGNFVIDQLSENISPPSPVAIQALEQAEVQFRGLSANGAFIKVDFSHVPRANPLVIQDLAPIAQNIWHLDLSNTRVSDQDLMKVGKLPNLRKLELNNTQISDAGIAHLQGLKLLETLNLYGTTVSDAGLGYLEPLTNLKKLHLYMTGTTKAGADALQAKLPDVEISLD